MQSPYATAPLGEIPTINAKAPTAILANKTHRIDTRDGIRDVAWGALVAASFLWGIAIGLIVSLIVYMHH